MKTRQKNIVIMENINTISIAHISIALSLSKVKRLIFFFLFSYWITTRAGPQPERLGQAKARSFIPGCHMGGRGPGTWTTFCYFSQAFSKELHEDVKQLGHKPSPIWELGHKPSQATHWPVRPQYRPFNFPFSATCK